MAVERGGRSDTRQRRALQKLSDNFFGSLGVVIGSGLVWDPATMTLSIDLAANSGLEFTGVAPADQLRIIRGTANQLYGMSATALPEFKALAVGTTGTDFAIAHAAGTITFNLPDASTTARGVVSTGNQTFNGNKTFGNGVLIFGTLEPDGGMLSTNPFSWSALDSWSFSGADVFWDVASFTLQLFSLTSVFDIQTTGTTVTAYDNSTTTIRGGNPFLSNPGGQAIVIGGQGAGSNQNGGEATVRGGKPTGTGTSVAKINVQNNAGTVQPRIEVDLNGIGFFGATPIAQPGTYTITAAPAVGTALNVTAATYTGIDNAQAGTPYAKVADLNTASAEIANLTSVVRQLIKHLGDTSGLGALNETGY